MDLQGLKTGLFGFKKKDVCEYISQMNDELGKRLSIEKEKDNATIAELKSKIESLSAGLNPKLRLKNLRLMINSQRRTLS